MGKPNLYIAEAKLFSNNGILLDIYRETFGFRSVTINQGNILINKKSFYCHGFGMHEDFEVHGRGFDRSIMIKDFNMFEWLNGNCYRTTHYPYSEERAYEADRRGIAVITEVPAVGIRRYDSTMSKLHAKIITEMISRDKNHPSVIAWSLSNEPVLEEEEDSLDYFSELVSLTRYLDKTRPITAVFGFLNFRDIREELISFRKQFPEKPLYITEYGAEAIPGLHDQPSSPFTEQYQVELIIKTTQVFDELRNTGNLSGEMIWNFADFMTAPSLSRIMGNHKGVLTRDRKPKMAAHLIRKRYGHLLNEQQKQNQKNEL
ncbi:hypothetical protein Mgra_00003480 [Meloidogyne graminicola]|uniref:Glycoside hydrolase family 2 catalytic domain-containing protein n=1 Tax=Meloidogyne graminicola TaxID=189291 RepID=A0A8S9ZVT2_9BILA|nr:hypothetical protein Mgra_00003480 [Meloidogyne graminicola]